jgi:hypothetical protein
MLIDLGAMEHEILKGQPVNSEYKRYQFEIQPPYPSFSYKNEPGEMCSDKSARSLPDRSFGGMRRTASGSRLSDRSWDNQGGRPNLRDGLAGE